MALSSSPQYLVNPRLGAYFGIFSALFVAVFVLGLILAELGAPEGPLRLAAVIAPLVLYAGLGAASVTNRAGDFFGSGRRVPAVYNGAVLAISAAGGVGVVCGTGLIYLHGFDAWAILTGVTAGFVLMAVLFAPYIRKFGAYTLPSFLGRRLDSRFVRVAAAATAAVPILLILIAELRLGVWIARELTGMQERVLLAGLVTTVICCTVLGGMRANTWSGTAQLIACLGALVVLAGVVGIVMTNFPVAQLSYGPVLRSIGRIETGLAISDAQVAPWAFRIAANELAAPIGQMAEPFSSIGAASF
ncbi:MAG: sodium:solute symporter, partial [Pseudomonadota bacterium]